MVTDQQRHHYLVELSKICKILALAVVKYTKTVAEFVPRRNVHCENLGRNLFSDSTPLSPPPPAAAW